MTDYRVYKLDSSTTGPPLIVYCEDDDAALIIAKRAMAGEGHTIEIWNGGRRITTIPSDLDGERPLSGAERTRCRVDSLLLLVAQSRHLIGQRIESARPQFPVYGTRIAT
jgi:hypothetical protein